MLTLDPVLAAALEGGGVDRVEHWCEIWQAGVRVATAELTGGTVTQSSDAAVRRTVDLSLAGFDGIVPVDELVGTDRAYGDGTFGSGIYGDYRHRVLRGLLLPLKSRIHVFSTYTVGLTSWDVPQGRFTIGDPEYQSTATGTTVRVSGWDLAGDVATTGIIAPYTVAAGTNVATAIEDLLTDRMPGIVVDLPTTAEVTPRMVWLPGEGVDPWAEAQRLAAAAGWVLWVDRDDTVVATDAPDPSTGSVVLALTDVQHVIAATHVPSGREVINTVVVRADVAGDVPVYAVVQDTGGTYGTTALGRVVVKEYSGSGISDATQAHNTGVALLRKWSGLTETITMDVIPLPHLDVDDLVSVSDGDLQLDDDSYRVTGVSFPLDAESPTQVTVSRRLG